MTTRTLTILVLCPLHILFVCFPKSTYLLTGWKGAHEATCLSLKKKWLNKAGTIWGPGPFWSLKSVGKCFTGTVHSASVNGESVRSNCLVTCWFWHCLLANWMELLKQDGFTPSLTTTTVFGLWSLTSPKASCSVRSLCSARIWGTVKRCQCPSSVLCKFSYNFESQNYIWKWIKSTELVVWKLALLDTNLRPGIGPGLMAIIFFLEQSELEGEIIPRTFRVLECYVYLRIISSSAVRAKAVAI